MERIMQRITDERHSTAHSLCARRSSHCGDATRREKPAGQNSSVFRSPVESSLKSAKKEEEN